MTTLNIFAPSWDERDSYGRVAVELREHLARRGVIANPLGGDIPEDARWGDDVVIHPAFGGFLLAWPTNFRDYGLMSQHAPRVAITMFESTVLPDKWAQELNRCDAVIVPSQWLIEVFREAGVTAPIHVVPLGISDSFQYQPRVEADAPFTFIAIGDGGERKGAARAAFAFRRAFGYDERYRLILKVRPKNAVGKYIDSNIVRVAEDLSERELAALYGRCDCMVFPTAGEGFGMPPREFAATGGMVIATDWGGTADDIDQWGIPLRYTMGKAWDGHAELDGIGEWAYPDIDHLAALMREVAQVPLAERNARGLAAADAVRRLYSWETFGDCAYAIWKAAAEHPVSIAI